MAIPFQEAQVLGWLLFIAGAALPIYVVFGVVRLSGLREITRYDRGRSFLYGLNPGTKLLALFLVALSASYGGPDEGLVVTAVILFSYLTLFALVVLRPRFTSLTEKVHEESATRAPAVDGATANRKGC